MVSVERPEAPRPGGGAGKPTASESSVAGAATNAVHTPPDVGSSSADEKDDLRRQAGKLLTNTQQTVDSNLTLFRAGLILTFAGSLVAAVRLSGLMQRVNSVEDIPLWQFARRKKLRVRMMRQSEEDPSVFYVYHTPFLRRTVLKDALPQTAVSLGGPKKSAELLAVRPFGIQVDGSAQEWVWAKFVSSHRYLTIELLQRLSVQGSESVAMCNLTTQRPPIGRDFAQELVSNGYAECIPELLDNYDNGSKQSITSLAQRLKKLEAAQKHAQVMQYGIWSNWQEKNLSDRVVSAGKRATSRGFKKLFSKISL